MCRQMAMGAIFRGVLRLLILGLDCVPPALLFDRCRGVMPNVSALIERVIAVKHELDTLDTDEPLVRPRPPASYEPITQPQGAKPFT